MKWLVGFPVAVVLLMTSAAGLVLGTASEPYVSVTFPGLRSPVVSTDGLLTRCREVAQTFADEGVSGAALVTWVAIAGAESSCYSNALGDNYPIRGLLCPSHGWMQIRSCPGTPGGLDRGSRESLIVPVNNVRKALQLARAVGWRPWTTYLTGRYLDYTPVALAATEGYR